MKILSIIFSVIIAASCSDPAQNQPASATTEPESASYVPAVEAGSDTAKWTDQFLELRKAITTGNRKALKSFIDFPIKNEGNEIWFLADPELVMEINSRDIKPFTEADYDKYFSSVFANDLRKTLEKLNVEEFFKTNKSGSPEVEVVKNTKSKIDASYDKGKQILTLAVSTSGPELPEYAVIYEFEVQPNQQIKFRQVRVKG